MFNQKSRLENSMKASSIGIFNQVISLVISFVYRTVFLYILSIEYLGLSDLFADILKLLSLAELGIGTAIIYRLYAPVKNEDLVTVGKLMNFYRTVYRIIALIIAVAGLLIMPFIKFFIKNANEIPTNINIYVIYALFLLQTLSTYMFSYKQSLLSVDQRNQTVSVFNMICNLGKNGGMILILFFTKNYTLTLATSIFIQITLNIIFAIVITKQYKEVFEVKEKLEKVERKAILHDTSALLLHKVGGVVLSGTDRIIITAFIGLGVGGMYSNYAMIVSAIALIIAQITLSLTPSIGNLIASKDYENETKVFDKIFFLNMWIAGFCAIGLFTLLNSFITVWLSAKMLLPIGTVFCICLNFFILSSRGTVGSFINASGLFVKDKIRPIIEAILNIIISIVLVNFIGLSGVFLGTFLSCAVTALWREPYVLGKFHFKKDFFPKYCLKYFAFVVLTVAVGTSLFFLMKLIPDTIGFFVLKFFIVVVVTNIVFAIATCWTKEFKSYFIFVKNIFSKIARKFKRKKTTDNK